MYSTTKIYDGARPSVVRMLPKENVPSNVHANVNVALNFVSIVQPNIGMNQLRASNSNSGKILATQKHTNGLLNMPNHVRNVIQISKKMGAVITW